MSDRGRMGERTSLGSSVGNSGQLGGGIGVGGAGNERGNNNGNANAGSGGGAPAGSGGGGGGHHHSASAGSGGALSFLPNLFGRRPIASVRTTDVAVSGSNSHRENSPKDRRASNDFHAAISPRNRLKPLPFGDAGRRSPSPNMQAVGAIAGAGSGSVGQSHSHSPAPFDLQSTIELMEKDEPSAEVLCEYIKASAVYLGLLVQDHLEAVTIPPGPGATDKHPSGGLPTAASASENPLSQITTNTVFRLYKIAIKHSQPKTPRSVRSASKRLLAALIAVSPPVGQGFVPAPSPITVAALYKIIIGVGRKADMNVDEVYVEVGALKALTKNGLEVDSTEGIVGWLVQTLVSIQEEYIKWCKQTGDDEWDDVPRQRPAPFDPIKPANPSEAVCAIIDLISAIISSHACLFSYADLRTVCSPIFALFWRGATAEHPARAEAANTFMHTSVFSPVRRDSPIMSATASPSLPSLHALGIEPGLRRSISLKRSRADTVSSQGTSRPGRQSSMSDSLKSPPMLGIAIRSPSPSHGPVGSGHTGHGSVLGGMSSPMGRPKWSRPMTSFAAFFEALYKNVAIPTDVFREAVAVACLAMGQDPEDGLALDVESAAQQLITLALSPAAGRRGEKAVRMLLEGSAARELKIDALRDIAIDRCATRGAVIACNTLISNTDTASDPTAACAMATVSASLRAAQSTSRFDQQKMFAPTEAWELVDAAILGLLQTHLIQLGGLPGQGQGAKLGDAWAEGQAACEILEGFVPIVTASPHFNLSELRVAGAASPTMADAEWSYGQWMDKKTFEGDDVSTLLPLFEAVLHQLPKSIEHLHSSTSSSPTFYHPKYIELLLKLGGHLDADDANVVISYYERECLCLPFTSGWIENIWALIRAFMLGPKTIEGARLRVGKLLLSEVYPFASDIPESRIHLVETVILPFLKEYLPLQQDDEFQALALKVLVNAAVVETFERDEERRQVRATKATNELEEEDASPEASQEVTEATFSGSFNTIRGLIAELAHIPCKDDPTVPPPPAQGTAASSTPSDATSLAAVSRSTSVRKERNLKGTISPPQRSRDLPSISSIASPMVEEPPGSSNILHAHAHSHTHAECRSIQAVTSLIAIFTQLCFTPQYHNTQTSAAVRMPASFRSIIVFRDLLGLLYPMTDDRARHKHTPTQVRIAAKCPKARLTILEWLMRLRADQHHRLFVRGKIDEVVMPFAAMLRRTKDTEAEGRAAEAEEAVRRARARPVQPLRQDEERGRPSRSQESSTRSRSRSKAAPVIRGVDHTYNPLWCVPQATLFEVPKTEQSSEIMTTYDPFHPALKNPDSAPIDGVWLPVSQYVRVLNGILRGHDWELVSYVLCFLPLQLRNKLFFHGWRAVKEVRALLEVLVQGVMDKGAAAWEKRFNVPTFIKRIDINAIAYQSLSILLAYRGTLRRDECDSLVQAFIEGLQARKEIAKPCLQALTLCIYELEQYVARHLLTIIDKMERIVTTTALAVHIVEFLCALGQNMSLFRNFTDDQYRRVFHVAIDYITIHNARSDEPVDLEQGNAREEYTLSQHVIGLAYYSIYLWFISLKLPSRPNLVPEITRKLLQGRSKRVIVDEMAEVCFDWLARYTYGNADPRPATSFLTEVVMSEEREGEAPKTYSWLLGGAIVTVTSHARTGWATIMTTRPTGSTSIVCKLENVPFLDVGESNADLASLPAFLMATRNEIAPADEGIADAKQLAKVTSNVASPHGFDAAAQHGFVWSGATPSQRRKDVQIHPSYIALQLLSSYPNASLETPRGRLIPQEEKFQRALRGIQNTPVIDTLKIAVLYAAPGQYTETEILGNIDGSPLYLDFLSGLGRLIKLKGQVDVFVGGLNRENDSDGEYAYAWWDDFDQVVFHTPTMMPNLETHPTFDNKKRLVGNDFVKIIYNESGRDFAFDTIRTSFNFINIVISPLTLGEGTILPEVHTQPEDGWPDWDREEWFKVEVQRAPGIPDFAPFGEGRLVSRHSLPILVRQIVIMANDLAARFMHIRGASNAAEAEYITSWRSRLRALVRLRDSMPKFDLPDAQDEAAREELKRDFTRQFTYR